MSKPVKMRIPSTAWATIIGFCLSEASRAKLKPLIMESQKKKDIAAHMDAAVDTAVWESESAIVSDSDLSWLFSFYHVFLRIPLYLGSLWRGIS